MPEPVGVEDDFWDEPDAAVPDEVLKEVPKGAAALAGVSVLLLMAAWLAIYAFIFLPRGMVG